MKQSNKGIASNPLIHKFASSKGGRARVSKGLAKLPPERRQEIASMGGHARHDNRNKETVSPPENYTGITDIGVDGISGALDEEKL